MGFDAISNLVISTLFRQFGILGSNEVITIRRGEKEGMRLTLETDREDDGRWIAEVPELPGVLAYGATQEEAMTKAEALALRVLAEQLDHGETKPIELSFAVAAE